MAPPEATYQNSAGRLLAILNLLPNEGSYLNLLPKLLRTSGKTPEETLQISLEALFEIHKLYLEFRKDMFDTTIGDQQRNVLFAGLLSLQQSIYPVSLNAAVRAATEAEKALLEVAATIIPQEDKLENDDIEKIRESITSLRTLIEDAQIPSSIRKVLLDLIRISENALSRFHIHGARGLRKAFKEMLAEAMELYGSSGEGEREALKKSGAWTGIVNSLRVFDEIGSRLLKYKPLLESVSQLFLGGPRNSGN